MFFAILYNNLLLFLFFIFILTKSILHDILPLTTLILTDRVRQSKGGFLVMKKLAALSLILSMMCGLVACSNSNSGSSDGGTESKDEGKSDGKVSINVIAAQYGQNTKTWWEDFVKDFTAEHSDIDLTAPDILNIDVFANYQADDLLLPAEDFVSKETYDKMYPAFLEQSNIDGTIWAIPDLASARALYYNADIL